MCDHKVYTFSEVDDVIPSSVREFSRWYTNHAHLLMAIYLVSVVFCECKIHPILLQVIQNEPEWSVTYEEVLIYLKESYTKMIINLKYGV